tara:strand:- start:435 stop:779 length:345 start_codon:yes stop_codon:yes gene_type:complete
MLQKEARLGAEVDRRQDIVEASTAMSEKILRDGDLGGGEKVILAALFNELSGPRPMFRMKAADLLLDAFSMKGKNRKRTAEAEESLGRLKTVLEKIQVMNDGSTETERVILEEG